MKIRTRLAIAFLTITVVPISLILMAIMTLNNYQGKMVWKHTILIFLPWGVSEYRSQRNGEQ